jgi:hypothetical protein
VSSSSRPGTAEDEGDDEDEDEDDDTDRLISPRFSVWTAIPWNCFRPRSCEIVFVGCTGCSM